jgi:hypothetical protein
MIRSVLFSVALSALLIYGVLRLHSSYEQRLGERVTSVDIYATYIAYRTNRFATPSLLEIGLKAAKDPPEKVVLHDCLRMAEFEEVVDLIRHLGYTEFEIELPPSC